MLSAAGPREHVLQENQGKGQQEEGSFECQDMSVLSVTLASFSHGCREYEGGNFVGREGRRRCVYRRERKREKERERNRRREGENVHSSRAGPLLTGGSGG